VFSASFAQLGYRQRNNGGNVAVRNCAIPVVHGELS